MTSKADVDEGVDAQPLSDNDLIRMISEGDTGALETLYGRYSRVVYSFALRIVSDPQIAEEILQEVFFRAWRQGNSYKSSRGTLITWLLSITHNLSIDEVRKRNRRPQKADSAEPETLLATVRDESQDVEEIAWLGSLRGTIVAALAKLPESQRRAIELAYFDGLTQREISETLDEPLGTVKTRMRLGMLKLRDHLATEFEKPGRTGEETES